MSKCPIELDHFRVYEQRCNSPYDKPTGLWYAFGSAWLDWCKSEMPHWRGKYFYEVFIGESRMLVIHDELELDAFSKKYGIEGSGYSIGFGRFELAIDWESVAKDYDGIDIPVYLWSCRMEYSWYYGWDVAAGCIWNLRQVEMIPVTKKKKELDIIRLV